MPFDIQKGKRSKKMKEKLVAIMREAGLELDLNKLNTEGIETEEELNVALTNFILADCAERMIAKGVTIPVRCKECCFCMDRKTYLRCTVRGFNNGHEVRPDGFCSDGQRRDDL